MPVDIHTISDGWLELESDPGLFTLLIEDFGCRGVQVEEIYDLNQKPHLIEGPVYGFIFLFKWLEERRSRNRYINSITSATADLKNSNERKTNTRSSSKEQNDKPVFVEDEEVVNSLFFAQQLISNSCATHAIVSVLLNSPNVDLGPVLMRLKEHTTGMSPENKGHAIGNTPELAKAHNAHASIYDIPDSSGEKLPAATTSRTSAANQVRLAADSFHFVSYVPINNRLYELDGLKRYPIDHGPVGPGDSWTEKFREIITLRLALETQGQSEAGSSHDIRYNLMAVVPDKRVTLVNKLKNLKSNRHIVLEALERMIRPVRLPEPFDNHCYSKYPTDLEYCDSLPSPRTDSPIRRMRGRISDDFGKPLTVDTTTGHFLGGLRPTSHLSPRTSTSPRMSAVSPALSSTSSATDTCSEAGSAFNSPNPGCASTVVINPAERVSKFFVCKVVKPSTTVPQELINSPSHKSPSYISPSAAVACHFQSPLEQPSPATSDASLMRSPMSSPRTKTADLLKKFAPRDLVALLKALEDEIKTCESNLKEELEKRKRYRVDDSRRTHNYEEFITTFILMLAEQGKLPDLLEKALNNGAASTHNAEATDNNIESPESPSSAFFAELASNFGVVDDDGDEEDIDGNNTKPNGIDELHGDGLAEFMTKLQTQGSSETKKPVQVNGTSPPVRLRPNVASLTPRRRPGITLNSRRRRKPGRPGNRNRYRRNRV